MQSIHLVIRRLVSKILFALCLLSFSIGHLSANTEWTIKQTLKTDSAPVDVAVSPDWQKMFILTEDGEILIYSSSGAMAEKIRVGTHVDQIQVGPQGNILILKSAKERSVQILGLEFIKDVSVSGAPIKGAHDAPVTIAVFSDFE